MRASLALLIALAACAEAPDFGPGPDGAALGAWPVLQPLPGLLAQGEGGVLTEADAGSLQARAAALRARARRLSGPVIEPATRTRMEAALRHPPKVAVRPGSG